VPVTVELSPELALSQPMDFRADLKIRGPKEEKEKLSPRQLMGRVKVTARSSGDITRVELRPEHFQSSTRFKVLEVTSGALALPLQQKISRSVPVEPRFSGKLPDEYVRVESRCSPQEVLVTGPERAVRSLNSVYTKDIPLDGAESSFTYESQLVQPQPMTVSPERVLVQVELARSHISQLFHKLPVLIAGLPGSGLRAEFADQREVDVTLSGSESRMQGLQPADISVFIDLSAIREPGVRDVPVVCHVKKGEVEVKAISPGEIKVKLTRVSQK